MRRLVDMAVVLLGMAVSALVAGWWNTSLGWAGVVLALAALVAVSLDSLFVWADGRRATETDRMRAVETGVVSERLLALEQQVEAINRKQAIQSIR